jgi:hypothetical protein
MAKGGRRKGSGRKPTGKVAMLVRVAPEVRASLAREAKLGRRSLSAVAEAHLADAIRAAGPADKQTRALCYLITAMVKFAAGFDTTGDHRFSWRTNRFDFEAFKLALMQILDWLAPAGAVGKSHYPRDETPEQVGQRLYAVITDFLPLHEQLLDEARARGAPPGSLYYAFPQAARDLGLTGENK